MQHKSAVPALTIQKNRLVASVALIEALGGGWTTADGKSNVN